MAVSCLEVWRESEIEMPATAAKARDMVSDDLACLGMYATHDEVHDIVDRIMTTLAAERAADFWTGAEKRSDS